MTFENEAVEWSDEIVLLVEQLDEKSEGRGLSREERAVLDVVETVQMLGSEDGGLYDFWQSGANHRRIIGSFDLIGSSTMVDVLNASQWCQTRTSELTETESDYLSEIEEELYEAMGELPDQVSEFIEEELG